MKVNVVYAHPAADSYHASLHERIKAIEHRLLPRAVALVLAGATTLEGRTTTVDAGKLRRAPNDRWLLPVYVRGHAPYQALDITVTLAALLGIEKPADALGRVLNEAFQ